jgi:hypothetical protein
MQVQDHLREFRLCKRPKSIGNCSEGSWVVRNGEKILDLAPMLNEMLAHPAFNEISWATCSNFSTEYALL